MIEKDNRYWVMHASESGEFKLVTLRVPYKTTPWYTPPKDHPTAKSYTNGHIKVSIFRYMDDPEVFSVFPAHSSHSTKEDGRWKTTFDTIGEAMEAVSKVYKITEPLTRVVTYGKERVEVICPK